MDRKEYLNEISAANRPVAVKTKNKLLSSKFFWIGVIGVVAFIIILIIGSLLGSSNTSVKDRLFSLILHIDNTSSVIDEYQSSVKSSDLRSDSASLNTILSGTSSSLTNYATEKYNFKPKDVKESIAEEETSAKDALMSELFNAKITGTLDRIYAQKMAYEISFITSSEVHLIKAISDSSVKDSLTTSYESLNNLYNNFNNFSESK